MTDWRRKETCQICAARAREELHDGGLVAEGRVVHRAVAVLVLDLHLGGRTQQDTNHLWTKPIHWLKLQYECCFTTLIVGSIHNKQHNCALQKAPSLSSQSLFPLPSTPPSVPSRELTTRKNAENAIMRRVRRSDISAMGREVKGAK